MTGPYSWKPQQTTNNSCYFICLASKSHRCVETTINTIYQSNHHDCEGKHFRIICCDQCRDCIPYNYIAITVTLCLDYLRTACVFYEFQEGGRALEIQLENVQLCMFVCTRVIVHTMFLCRGCTSSTRQHMLPVFKILSIFQQERALSFFIYFIPFLPCGVCVMGMKSPEMKISVSL